MWASRGSEGGPVAVVAVDGGDELRSVAACEKQRRGGRSEESEMGRGVAWRRGRGPGRREEGGKQEVAGASPALATELLRGEGRKTTGGGRLVGWAAQELGRLG